MNFKVVFVLAVAVVGCALAVPLEKEKEKEAAKPAAAPAKNDSLPLPPSGEKKEKTGRAIMDMSMPMMMNSGRPMMNSMGNMGNMNNMGMRLRRAAPEVEKKPEELLPKNDSLPTPAPAPKPKRDAEEHIKDDKKPLNETMPPKELGDKDKKPLNATLPASKPKRDAEEAEKKPVDLSKKNETLSLGAGNKTEEHKHSKRDAEEEMKKSLEGEQKDKKPFNGTTPAPTPKPKRDAEEPPKEHEDKDKKPKEGAGKKPADLPKKNETLSAAGDKTEEHKPTRSTMCDDEFGCDSKSKMNIRKRRSDYGSGSSQIRLSVRSRPVARAQQVRTVVRDDSYEDSEPLLIREAPARQAVRVVAAAPTQTVRLSSYEEDEPVLIREAAPVTVVRSAPRARVVAAPARAVRVSSGGYDSEVVADEQLFVDDEGYGGEVRVAAAPVRARTVVRSRSSGY
ncbi:unnamed protein product [Orchesella dallaii]|uniref:Uncharacterized protein n=1 Tax=Orchesella dallaii TaxID=48710 RepID=A0ABP1RQ65_9HEXA